MSITTPKGINYAKLRNVQRKSKPDVDDIEEKSATLLQQLSKDLNQDNLHYINSLLKGRSTSQQVPQDKKQMEPKPVETLDPKNIGRAKSFFERPSSENDIPPNGAASVQAIKSDCFSLDDQKTKSKLSNHFSKPQIFTIQESLSNSALNSNNTSQQTQINIQDVELVQPPQEKLFDQFFKTEALRPEPARASNSFLDFIDTQINYHSSSHVPVKQLPNRDTTEIKLLRQQMQQMSHKIQQMSQSRKELIQEYTQYKARHEEERAYLKKIIKDNSHQQQELTLCKQEIKHLKKQRNQANKKCELLQELLVRERMERESSLNMLNNMYAYNKEGGHKKIQEVIQTMHSFKPQIVQDTVSSLADEKFESNDHSLRSSISRHSIDEYEKRPHEQIQRRMDQVSTQDISRVMLMQQYDSKKRQINLYSKYEDVSNDLTNNSMFSAHNNSD